MRGIRHGLTTAWRVVRAEGLRSAVDRARDRLAERGERRRAVTVAPGGLGHAPVVNVVGMPLSSRLGGVPTQLRNRLAFESEERACVTLSPGAAGWRLEYVYGPERRVLASADVPPVEAIRWAMGETGADAVHLEGLAGMTENDLGALARQGARLVISVHDYSVLRQDFDVQPGAQARYREATSFARLFWEHPTDPKFFATIRVERVFLVARLV